MTSRTPVVVVTRDERRDQTLSRALTAAGATPRPLQTVAVEALGDLAPLRAALGQLGTVDWVVFTSAHAVEITCRELASLRPARSAADAAPGFAPARVAAVGRRTAARLAAHGIRVDLVPDDASASGLVAALSAAAGLEGRHVLWPSADRARGELGEGLTSAGARLTVVAVYRTVQVRPPDLAAFVQDLREGTVDAILFLSPSSACGLAAALPDGTLESLAGRTLVCSIGPTTSGALATLGAPPDLEPAERSAEALAGALVEALHTRRIRA